MTTRYEPEKTFNKSIPASLNNKQQRSLEALKAFMDSGISTSATDNDIRDKLYDEQESYLGL